MKRDPGLREDAKNLSLITASACAAALFTAGLLFANAAPEPAPIRHEVRIVRASAPTYTEVTPLSGSNRLYGTVRTVRGGEYTGFIRWDRNEGSWADLLDANKPARRGERVSGIRFGHVDRIEVLSDDAALFTLKSGDRVELRERATDLGDGLRALVVDDPAGGSYEFGWQDLYQLDFRAAPADVRPREGRMFGTVTTQRGLQFTGYVTWDVDEIYSSDVLDGDLDGDRRRIPFGAIASIGRYSSRAALVILTTGEELILDGTQDVNRSNNGISVSDPGLGQVLFGWNEFDNVRFHGTDTESAYADFSGGSVIRGTVVTDAGEELTGEVRWDDDETYTWEILNGSAHGLEFHVEFGRISRIARAGRGARVTLRDGRTFELSDSNDVDRRNNGIVVTDGGRSWRVDWRDFRELRLER